MTSAEQPFDFTPAVDIDYSHIEKRIMGIMAMDDTTLNDLYGTEDNAWTDMRKALRTERRWSEMPAQDKVLFQEWTKVFASSYKDDEKIDWIGAFYDWLEGTWKY